MEYKCVQLQVGQLTIRIHLAGYMKKKLLALLFTSALTPSVAQSKVRTGGIEVKTKDEKAVSIMTYEPDIRFDSHDFKYLQTVANEYTEQVNKPGALMSILIFDREAVVMIDDAYLKLQEEGRDSYTDSNGIPAFFSRQYVDEKGNGVRIYAFWEDQSWVLYLVQKDSSRHVLRGTTTKFSW